MFAGFIIFLLNKTIEILASGAKPVFAIKCYLLKTAWHLIEEVKDAIVTMKSALTFHEKQLSRDSRSSRDDLTVCSSSPGSSVSSASSGTRILSAAVSSLCLSFLSSSVLPSLSAVSKSDGAVMGQLQFSCCVRFSTPASFSHVPPSLVTRDSLWTLIPPRSKLGRDPGRTLLCPWGETTHTTQL